MFDAFARRDIDAVLELIDPAVEFHAVTGEVAHAGKPYRGIEGMRAYFADVERIWDELVLSPADFDDRGDEVLVTGRVWARGAGRIVDSSAGWIWRVRDGRVAYIRVYQSASQAAEAAGPTPEA